MFKSKLKKLKRFAPNAVSEAALGYLPLTTKHSRDLQDAMRRHLSASASQPNLVQGGRCFPRSGKCFNHMPLLT